MTHVRILYRDPAGRISDGELDFPLESFAGHVPMIGDTVVNPGVLEGQDRNLPQNRQIWTVVGRVFNPRDNEDYVALIVEARDGYAADEAFL